MEQDRKKSVKNFKVQKQTWVYEDNILNLFGERMK